jgi:hypothetical protein
MESKTEWKMEKSSHNPNQRKNHSQKGHKLGRRNTAVGSISEWMMMMMIDLVTFLKSIDRKQISKIEDFPSFQQFFFPIINDFFCS